MADISVCLNLDVDWISAWIGKVETKNTSALSRGEFDLVGTQRVLAFP